MIFKKKEKTTREIKASTRRENKKKEHLQPVSLSLRLMLNKMQLLFLWPQKITMIIFIFRAAEYYFSTGFVLMDPKNSSVCNNKQF